MVMDFWAAQRRARSKTKIYMTIFIFLTLLVATGVELAMRYFSDGSYDPPLPLLGLLFIGITLATSGYNYAMYSGFGGDYVAESLGAIRVNPMTANPMERQLLNIVEEIALASSLPMPSVYIINAREINAFAAGLTSSKSAIAITNGALRKLNRDEIQGVIAHEFGHIYNGDMKISMRLAAMVMGFYIILFLGLRILQFSSFRSSRDDRKGGNPIVLAAIIFMIAGAVTWFFGSILKACVSREREYLADACAVQFTRNPSGIADALRKIGAMQQEDDMPQTGMAFSHMYFDDRSFLSALFATHPPLEDRIAAIEGGTYMPEEPLVDPNRVPEGKIEEDR